jgi:uncharacterized protein (UPF0305 family)
MFKRELQDPLKYLDTVQQKLDLSCYKIKDVPFQKKSRICRNIIISDIVDLVHKYEIRGYFWGLMAGRPLYYLYPLFSQLEGFYNFDFCEKKQFKFLELQTKYLSKLYPTLDIRAINKDIFEVFRDTNKDLPTIIELDGMKTLNDEQIEKISWLVKEKLPDSTCLLSITSTIGRVPGFTQEFYEKMRDILINNLKEIRCIKEHKSIEYAEPRTETGPHYPMRTEILVFEELKEIDKK